MITGLDSLIELQGRKLGRIERERERKARKQVVCGEKQADDDQNYRLMIRKVAKNLMKYENVLCYNYSLSYHFEDSGTYLCGSINRVNDLQSRINTRFSRLKGE